MATLVQTLGVFRDLLAAGEPIDAGEADEAIWAYLTPIHGLDAQVQALADLTRATSDLDHGSPFMPRLRDTLARHRTRLSEPSA